MRQDDLSFELATALKCCTDHADEALVERRLYSWTTGIKSYRELLARIVCVSANRLFTTSIANDRCQATSSDGILDGTENGWQRKMLSIQLFEGPGDY